MNSIKVCEYSRSLRSFHDDLILQDQASGERSQDHWSSGLFCVQNIDCGYALNRLIKRVLMSSHNLCFGSKIRKNGKPLYIPIYNVKIRCEGFTLHRHVILMR